MNIVVNTAAVKLATTLYMAEVLRLYAELLVDMRTLCTPLLAVVLANRRLASLSSVF